jgi:hypothetical protein
MIHSCTKVVGAYSRVLVQDRRMFLYNPMLANELTKTDLLRMMASNSSENIVCHDFEHVYWGLLVEHYPLEEPFHWLMRGQPTPSDLYQRQDYYFDNRRLCYWFWNSLCEPTLYGEARQRLPDGTLRKDFSRDFLTELTVLPFEVAINTWYAVCVEWLQICSIDWYYKEVKRYPQLKIWKPGEERHIPGYLAGMVALIYF